MTGPGIKPRRVPLGGFVLQVADMISIDMHPWNLLGTGSGRNWVRLVSGLGTFGEMERKLICSLGVLLARDYRTQGYG